MYNLTIIKSTININSKNKVLFFHGFGAPCSKYNITQWDDIKDEYYEDDEKVRKNNWLDNLVDVFNASELIYYNRPEENFLFSNSSGKHNLSKQPNLYNHILNLQNQLKKPYKDKNNLLIEHSTKLYLVCHSIGCAYGLKYYNMFPSNVKGIVIIDSYPLIPKIINEYSNKKFIPSDTLLKKLTYKRNFTDNEKNKLVEYIIQDITTNFKNFTCDDKFKIKLLCFWNIDIKQKKNNTLSREFSDLLKSKSLKKNFKSVEFKNRDHYLNETDDIKINNYINNFIL
jgi:hypothetical protein